MIVESCAGGRVFVFGWVIKPLELNILLDRRAICLINLSMTRIVDCITWFVFFCSGKMLEVNELVPLNIFRIKETGGKEK